MADAKPASRAAPKANETRKKFRQMTGKEKATFVLQAVVCICTGGFVFPNVFG